MDNETTSLYDYIKCFGNVPEEKRDMLKKYAVKWKYKPSQHPSSSVADIEWKDYKRTLLSCLNPNSISKYPVSVHERRHMCAFHEAFKIIGAEGVNKIINHATVLLETKRNTWLTVITPPYLYDLGILNENIIGKIKSNFYNIYHSSLWSEYSALQKNASVGQLVKAILTQNINYTHNCDLTSHVLHLEPSLQEMIRRHRKVNYREALKNYLNRRNLSKTPMTLTVFMHCIHFFVKKICPLSLFGNLHNKNKFMCIVKHTISKGYVNMQSKSTRLNNIDISKVTWLHNVPDDKLKLLLLQKLFSWILNDFIFSIIKMLFHVPRPSYNESVLFFTKSYWQKLLNRKINKSIKSKMWKQISEDELNVFKTRRYAPLPSKIRLIVKNEKIRTLTNLRHKDHNKEILRNSLQFLKQILLDYSGCKMLQYGCSFHVTWAEIKKCYEKLNEKKAYIVKTDITDAFGSIDLTLLKTIISFLKSKYKGHLIKTEYIIKRKLNGKYHTKKIFLFDNMNHEFPNNCTVSAPISREFIDIPQLFTCIKEYVQCQTLCFGKRNFWVQTGLPQGGLLSSVLCDIYYTNMERMQMQTFCSNGFSLQRLLPDCNLHETFWNMCMGSAYQFSCSLNPSVHGYVNSRSCEIVMLTAAGWLFRYVDDYLYITFDENWAKKFMDVVKFGFDKWNCWFNTMKTDSNIDGSEHHIKYLNYEIDTKTLGISRSFNAESELKKINNMYYNKEISWQYFVHIMTQRSKNILAICLDKRINSTQEIFFSVLKHSFRVAFAFHAILCIYFKNKNKIRALIYSCVENCYKVLLKRIRRCTNGDLKYNEVLWFILKGFHIKFSHHRCIYSHTTKKLKHKLMKLSHRLDANRLQEFKIIAESINPKKS